MTFKEQEKSSKFVGKHEESSDFDDMLNEIKMRKKLHSTNFLITDPIQIDDHLNGKNQKSELMDQDKPAMPTISTAYCTLCQVVASVGILDEHLKGKKHKKNVQDKEKSTKSKINSNDFIITDPTQMPYYCAVCEHSCVSQNELEKHLAGKKHQTNVRIMSFRQGVK